MTKRREKKGCDNMQHPKKGGRMTERTEKKVFSGKLKQKM
jgi:hypothetical protein